MTCWMLYHMVYRYSCPNCLTFRLYSYSNRLTFVSVGFFTLFVMFSCAPDPCQICRVTLSPLVGFCSESFLCLGVNKIPIIIIIKKTDTELFLEHLNSRNERISFTMESEKDGSLPYMDVLFTRQTDGTLKRKVFKNPRIPTDTCNSIRTTPYQQREVW